MDQIIGEIGKALGGFFGSAPVQFALQAIAVYLIILWLAGAYWAFRDMQQRTENPILPYVAASFIIIFTPIFFPLAIFVYKIIRPHEKIGEVYERNLAEEALLAEVEAIHSCPTCARRVNDEWIICPTCRTRLNRVCPNCSRRRARLVAVRLVRQGFRATRRTRSRYHAAARRPRGHRPHRPGCRRRRRSIAASRPAARHPAGAPVGPAIVAGRPAGGLTATPG